MPLICRFLLDLRQRSLHFSNFHVRLISHLPDLVCSIVICFIHLTVSILTFNADRSDCLVSLPDNLFYTRSESKSHGYIPGQRGHHSSAYIQMQFSLQTRPRQRTSLQTPNIVIRYNADSVMPQRLAADQHGSLVQLLPRFIFSASINLALIAPPGATVYPVIRECPLLPWHEPCRSPWHTPHDNRGCRHNYECAATPFPLPAYPSFAQ